MAQGPDGVGGVRLTELLAALSLGTDLGLGHPMEHVLRQSFLALKLAERLGLTRVQREVVYYSSLLAWVGCHVDAYEQAKWVGDDRAGRAGMAVDRNTLAAPVGAASVVDIAR